jgi:heme oxygenase (biliverdin-IX-beta and delta-forming)
VSAHALLRSTSWPHHQRLEKRLDVKRRFSDLIAYRAHLERMWGFCGVLEERVAPLLSPALLTDYPLRRKRPLLERDLEFLGMPPQAIERLPGCGSLPFCTDAASAFGCLYVLEGATLGGRTLAPLVLDRLKLTDRQGASFLASYGDHTPQMWQSFILALEAGCNDPEGQARAAAAASATFAALEEWLCGSRS